MLHSKHILWTLHTCYDLWSIYFKRTFFLISSVTRTSLRHKLLPLERPPVLPPALDFAPPVSACNASLLASDRHEKSSSQTTFAPPERPVTAERPCTASRVTPAVPRISFPGKLALRREGEGPLGLFSKPGEGFVLPLDVQGSVHRLNINIF